MTLSWKELLHLAVEIEKRGRDFYLALAGLTLDAEARRVLATLAAEEEEHAAVFARGLPGGEGELSTETRAYLEALLEGFARSAPAGIERVSQGLALAVEMEKDSILFYNELLKAVTNEEARKIVHEILRTEKLHLVEIRERLCGEG